MKNLIALLVVILLMSCKSEENNYAKISGKITNRNSDSLVVRANDYTKTIKVNQDGTFSDTLNVEAKVYAFFDGKQSAFVFLKNGFDIQMNFDAQDINQSLVFTGTEAKHSNFIAKNNLVYSQFIDLDRLINLNTDILDSEFESIKQKFTEFYDANADVDTIISNRLRKDLDPMLNYYKDQILEHIKSNAIGEGEIAPVFTDYENANGGTTSLTDFKGKYVYIDVWATWCSPCLAEIPALKNLEKAYKGKNIVFVSLSIDDGRGYRGNNLEEAFKLAKDGWKKMVFEKQLGGVQLIAPNGWQSQFIQDFKINGIPRFILIDKEGKIVNANAPRPSSKTINELLNTHGLN